MPKKKSLQKFTEIEELSSVKQVENHLIERPEDKSKVYKSLASRLTKSYEDKLGEEFEIEEMLSACFRTILGKGSEEEKDLRNSTYETNHQIISSVIHNCILENKIFPTISAIHVETALSRQTIYKHIKDGLGTRYNELVTGKLEYMTSNALSQLYSIGVKDRNATALKAYIELTGVVIKRTTTNINNYIQINNLKLSKEEFNQLPNDTILQIEKLISDSIKQL